MRAKEGKINFFLRMETDGKHLTKRPWTEGVDTMEREGGHEVGSSSSMLCAPGKMLKEKASAIGNVIVPEMLIALPMRFAHEVACWFHKGFQR